MFFVIKVLKMLTGGEMKIKVWSNVKERKGEETGQCQQVTSCRICPYQLCEISRYFTGLFILIFFGFPGKKGP
jgi:hypothetical protein